MPLPEIVGRGKQETSKWLDRLLSARTTADSDVERDSERLIRFVENSAEHFFPGVFDARLPQQLENADGDACQAILIGAHHAFHGRFDLLGYRNLNFGDPIQWQLDPLSGWRAPQVHWSRLDALDYASVGDAKVIWELNRHQWLVHLGQAWRLTGDERYAHAVVQQIRAWLRSNPTGIGINWASSLEVALRIVSWSWALLLIRDSHAVTPDFFRAIEAAVDAHGIHVERYLSYYFSPNTHLTGEALGLFYAGVVFSELKHAERWRSLGMRILVEEIDRQVHADGVYFERSTCYQRYTADVYLHFLILAGQNGIDVPGVVSERLRSLLDVLVAFRQPDGSMPSIGDGDSGRVLPLSIAPSDDYRATFSTAAVFYRDAVYAWAADHLAPESLWLLGSQAADVFEKLEKQPPATSPARILAAGGFVTMRSGFDENSHALIFDAGPLGCQFSAGHGHAALLSVQCSAFGERYLIDAGTCCYTANREVRDYFRTTAAHSTIAVDTQPQADPAGPFSWRNRCTAHLLQWAIGDTLTYADACSDAYRRLPDSVSHRRRVAFIRSRYWIIIDDLCGSDTHRVDVRFQFAPMQIRIDADGWVRATRNGKRGLLMRAFASRSFTPSVREGLRNPMEGWHSPSYGCMEPAPALVYSADVHLPVRIVTLLWPADDVDKIPEIEVLRDSDGRPCAIGAGVDAVEFDDDEIHVRNRGNH